MMIGPRLSLITRIALLFPAAFWGCDTVLAQAPMDVLRVIAMPTRAEMETAGAGDGIVIDHDALRTWRKLRDRALSEGATTIVLEVTTPGGDLQATKLWVEDLVDLQKNGVKTVAYIPTSATSAGAIIAAACGEILMVSSAEIGNAIPLEFRDVRGYDRVPEKILTEVKTLMGHIARRSGFSEHILHGMVDADRELLIVSPADLPAEPMWADEFARRYPGNPQNIPSRLIKSSGEALKLISGGSLEALRPFFPYQQVRSRDDIPRVLGFGERDLASSELLRFPTPSRFFPNIFAGVNWSILLLVAGILFFILELKTPGLGAFGVLGILSLVGYFAANTGDGPPIVLTLGLLILGFFLLLVEMLFIPGFGLAGVAGLGLILFSIYAATIGFEGETIYEQVIPDSPSDWQRFKSWIVAFMGSLVFGTSGALFLARQLHHVPFLQRAFIEPPFLRPPDARPTGEGAPGAVTAAGVVKVPAGAYGIADTDLRPAGKARFAQGLVDVVSEGDWIARGDRIRVVFVEGNRVVVAASRDGS